MRRAFPFDEVPVWGAGSHPTITFWQGGFDQMVGAAFSPSAGRVRPRLWGHPSAEVPRFVARRQNGLEVMND